MAVVQHGIEMQIFDLGDGGDVAGDRLFDLGVILALELEQVRNLERLLAIVDEQQAVLLHRALVDPEDAQLADEGIVDDLEHVGDHVGLRIRTCLHRFGAGAVAAPERRRVAFARVREQAFGHVQQFGHAGAGARGNEADRHQVALAQALLERIVQLRAGQAAFAGIEEMFHDRFVDLHDLVDDLLVPFGHRPEVGIALRLSEAIHHPATALGGQVQWQDFRAEGFAQVGQYACAVGTVVVDLVDHDGPAQIALAGAFHQPAGAVGHAGVGVDHDQRGLHGRQRRQCRATEFGIARRVDEIEVDAFAGGGQVIGAGDGGIDGVAAGLLDRIVIGHGGAAFDGACRLEGAAGMQQGFEERCFAGARVACQGHVADLGCAVGHEAVPPGYWGRRAVMAVRAGATRERALGGRSWRGASIGRAGGGVKSQRATGATHAAV